MPKVSCPYCGKTFEVEEMAEKTKAVEWSPEWIKEWEKQEHRARAFREVELFAENSCQCDLCKDILPLPGQKPTITKVSTHIDGGNYATMPPRNRLGRKRKAGTVSRSALSRRKQYDRTHKG